MTSCPLLSKDNAEFTTKFSAPPDFQIFNPKIKVINDSNFSNLSLNPNEKMPLSCVV